MSKTEQLRKLLEGPEILTVPGCYDAMTARLIQRAGFPAAFMSGFSVSASRLAMPDTGLITYTEMVEQGQNICEAVSIPVFGDGDTGYGNAVNVQRTVRGYARAGFSCIMIEDQVSPKRCGHTRGKQTVDRKEAFSRIQAAVDVRNAGEDILIMARTDANATEGLEEAVFRAKTFAEIGADITFMEAPLNEDEMQYYCENVAGPKMANMVEQGKTPLLRPEKLQEIGYKIVAYPLTLMLAGIRAMENALKDMLYGSRTQELAEFAHLREIAGFPQYYETEKHYAL